jgi:putative colanic acid biosysnthesis UDP-glucose lipid carrier transferase
MSVDANNMGSMHASHAARLLRAGLSERRVHVGSSHSPVSALLRKATSAAATVGSLLLFMLVFWQPMNVEHAALIVLASLLSSQLISPATARNGRSRSAWMIRFVPQLLFEWFCLIGVLMFAGYAFKVTAAFSEAMILSWCLFTPLLLIAAELVKSRLARALANAGGKSKSHIVIGANELGMELTRRTSNAHGSRLAGYFDDRSPQRLPPECHAQLRGTCADVVAFVQKHNIDSVYIALPLSAAPRITNLLNELRDTTASVYFVPDVLSFDVIQGRVVEIDGLAALSLCDTPFNDTRALLKRGMDVAIAGAGLLAIWPVMALIAIGVKLSSPGPVFFKQRRYGLNGEEILVYKFRSMTVAEDGQCVVQAKRGDARTTAFGGFLRRTSLDELPQIINVLEGKMSLVGPRPHAVAHNEQYRRLINGYMIRHKVRPGMTGWAQVNGLRGETDTVDKMRRRIEFDLDYLRHWSLWLDIKIVFRTLKLLVHDSQAY